MRPEHLLRKGALFRAHAQEWRWGFNEAGAFAPEGEPRAGGVPPGVQPASMRPEHLLRKGVLVAGHRDRRRPGRFNEAGAFAPEGASPPGRSLR